MKQNRRPASIEHVHGIPSILLVVSGYCLFLFFLCLLLASFVGSSGRGQPSIYQIFLVTSVKAVLVFEFSFYATGCGDAKKCKIEKRFGRVFLAWIAATLVDFAVSCLCYFALKHWGGGLGGGYILLFYLVLIIVPAFATSIVVSTFLMDDSVVDRGDD
ncbi:hypothetical protein OT109_16125 [Phycisphaeraceae bacterium D3-23]